MVRWSRFLSYVSNLTTENGVLHVFFASPRTHTLTTFTGVTLAVNARDGIRQGDTTETPLQFRYETADCRILYTPEMTVDVAALWKTVADTVWNGKDACIAGSNDFYGNGTYTKRAPKTAEPVHKRAAWPRMQSGANFEAMKQTLDEMIVQNTNGLYDIAPIKRSIMSP